MLSADIQFVLLGSGSVAFRNAVSALSRRFPSQVAVQIGYDEGLSTGSSWVRFLHSWPSRFEPSGLNQMYSLVMACSSCVAVGGLDDRGDWFFAE